MADEDDDLLRAAEELGIDLSGVRQTDGQAADEAVEGSDDTDAADEADDSDVEAPDIDLDAEIDLGEIPEDAVAEDAAADDDEAVVEEEA
jgi:DNA-directed RNA polymerase subunit beta